MIWHRFEKELAVLGGSRRDAAEKLPRALGRTAFFGMANLAASLAAAVAVGLVAGSAFRGPVAAAGAIVGASLAGLGVLALNRVLFIRPHDASGWRQRLVQAAPRMLLAAAVAWWVSSPLTLFLCKDAIVRELDSKPGGLSAREEASATEGAPRMLLQQFRSLQSLVERLRMPESVETAAAQFRAAVIEFENAQRELTEATASIQPALERNVKLLNRLLATPGADPALIATVRDQVAEQQRLLDEVKAKARHAQDRLYRAALDLFQTKQETVAQLGTELRRVEQHVSSLMKQESAQQAAGAAAPGEPMRPSFINQWRTLQRILADKSHPDQPAARRVVFWVYLFLLLFQLAPVLLNLLLPPDALARANEAFNFLDAERIVIGINAQVKQWRQASIAATPAQNVEPRQPQVPAEDNLEPGGNDAGMACSA